VGYDREDLLAGRLKLGGPDAAGMARPSTHGPSDGCKPTGRSPPVEKEYSEGRQPRAGGWSAQRASKKAGRQGVAFVLELTDAQAGRSRGRREPSGATRDCSGGRARDRVATMGSSTASIAHEVNQPIARPTNAQAALRWLKARRRTLAEVRQALTVSSRTPSAPATPSAESVSSSKKRRHGRTEWT